MTSVQRLRLISETSLPDAIPMEGETPEDAALRLAQKYATLAAVVRQALPEIVRHCEHVDARLLRIECAIADLTVEVREAVTVAKLILEKMNDRH